MDKAIERINRINWGVVGSNRSESVADLGYEYLRRLAQFFKEQSLKQIPPLYANIAELLGDTEVTNSVQDTNKGSVKEEPTNTELTSAPKVDQHSDPKDPEPPKIFLLKYNPHEIPDSQMLARGKEAMKEAYAYIQPS